MWYRCPAVVPYHGPSSSNPSNPSCPPPPLPLQPLLDLALSLQTQSASTTRILLAVTPPRRLCKSRASLALSAPLSAPPPTLALTPARSSARANAFSRLLALLDPPTVPSCARHLPTRRASAHTEHHASPSRVPASVPTLRMRP